LQSSAGAPHPSAFCGTEGFTLFSYAAVHDAKCQGMASAVPSSYLCLPERLRGSASRLTRSRRIPRMYPPPCGIKAFSPKWPNDMPQPGGPLSIMYACQSTKRNNSLRRRPGGPRHARFSRGWVETRAQLLPASMVLARRDAMQRSARKKICAAPNRLHKNRPPLT
jgi:hypothetical protein